MHKPLLASLLLRHRIKGQKVVIFYFVLAVHTVVWTVHIPVWTVLVLLESKPLPK